MKQPEGVLDSFSIPSRTRRSVLRAIGLLSMALLLSCEKTGTPVEFFSTDATLNSLSVSAGALTPAFGADNTAYTVAIPTQITELTVIATTTNANARISINGQPPAISAASAPLTLVIGANTLTIVVTAEDTVTTRTYTVVITRAAA